MASLVLERLFDRHYFDGSAALSRFRKQAATATFDFDVEGQIDEQTFPPQAELTQGMPSFIYYHVPGTGFGSVRRPTASGPSIDKRLADGIGLNRGCPIRLAHALDVLFTLRPEDQAEPLAMLKAQTSHLCAVEELLWLTWWKDQREVTRGLELVEAKVEKQPAKNVDWFFISGDTPVYLEAKFRQTDWARNADGEAAHVSDSLFARIGSKFPKEKSRIQRCVAGITGFAELDENFLALSEKKLLATNGLNAILYRTLSGPMYVCSLDRSTAIELASLIRLPEARDYPYPYPVMFNRAHHERRKATNPKQQLHFKGLMHVIVVPADQPTIPVETLYPYRYEIPKWSAKGDPIPDYVPPFID
jgi:hypothetical protein